MVFNHRAFSFIRKHSQTLFQGSAKWINGNTTDTKIFSISYFTVPVRFMLYGWHIDFSELHFKWITQYFKTSWNMLTQHQYTMVCFIFWTLSSYWTFTSTRSIYCDVLIIILNNIERVQRALMEKLTKNQKLDLEFSYDFTNLFF